MRPVVPIAPIAFAVAAGIALSVPPAAHAGTLSSSTPPCATLQSKYGQCDPTVITYAAAPGEFNRVTVTAEPSGAYVLRDEGASVEPGSCRRLDDHGARCDGSGSVLLVVRLGDEADTAVADAGTIDGGDGPDELRSTGFADLQGGPGADVLTGGPERDHLTGGPGSDQVSGGPGGDRLIDGDGGQDLYVGGDGADTVDYGALTTPVRVDLGTSGAAPDGDTLAEVEGVRGGAGPDVLLGGRGDDVLDGGGGDDALSGREGADRLFGNDGLDRLDGGPGDDQLSALPRMFNRPLDRAGERVGCGDGADLVRQDDDLIAADCEAIVEGAALVDETRIAAPPSDLRFRPHPVARTRRGWTFAVPCRARVQRRGRCVAAVVVRSTGGRLIAKAARRGAGNDGVLRVRVRVPGAVPSVVGVRQTVRPACRRRCAGRAAMSYRL